MKFRDPDGHPVELLAFPANRLPSPWDGAVADAESANLTPLGIDHSAITVASADASIAFYATRLGLRLQKRQINSGPEQGRLDGLDAPVVGVVALQAADAATPHLELLGYTHPRAAPSVEAPGGVGSHARTTLVWHCKPDSVLVTPSFEANSESGRSPSSGLYLEDPDGHLHLLLPRPSAPERLLR